MCSPSSLVKIRICDLYLLSEDAGDFRFGGLYVVMRLGPLPQRTSTLPDDASSNSSKRSWNEVFVFHIDTSPAASAAPAATTTAHTYCTMGTPPLSLVDGSTAAHLALGYHPVLQPHASLALPHQQQQQQSVGGALVASPWFCSPYGLPTITLELWRNSPESDDCLAKSQFCIPHEAVGANIVDRVVRLTSASIYSVQFTLRIRVAFFTHDAAAAAVPSGYDAFAPKALAANVSMPWRP